MTDDAVRLATRGSQLAMAQAEAIKAQIEAHRRRVELVEVSTTGDEIDDALIHELGTTGAFVRALDEEVLAERVDGAVHSMKDVPTEQPAELVVAAIPKRGPTADVLVTPAGASLAALPDGATVGTASLRRQAQLTRRRPDLEVAPIRGNVDTRIVKLYAAALAAEREVEGPTALIERASERSVETDLDAIVLAEAGLERAGFAAEVQTARLDEPTAAGQGAIAVTTLDTDLAAWLNDTIDDPRTRVEATVERCVLATLGGGCVAPIAVDAVVQGEHVAVEAQVLSTDGSAVVEGDEQLPVADHVEAAQAFAQGLIDAGADELVAEARRDGPGPRHRD